MPRYVIHVGPPKTGSKYLQSCLFYNREQMLKDGISYPDNWWGERKIIFHHQLKEQLASNDVASLRAAFDEINASDCDTVVLSSEGIEGLPAERLTLLKELTAGNQVELIYYVRRWSERIPSDWQQHVKMGRFETVLEFFLPMLQQATTAVNINYAIGLDKLARVFGRDSLYLVSYSNLKDSKVNIFEHFCRDVLGWEGFLPVPDDRIQHNVSPDLVDTEILRALNYLDAARTGRVGTKMRIKYFTLRDQLDVGGLARAIEPHVAELEIHDDAVSFAPAWEAISAYADRLVSKNLGQQIFTRKVNAFRYARPTYLLQRGVLDELERLYERIEASGVTHPDIT